MVPFPCSMCVSIEARCQRRAIPAATSSTQSAASRTVLPDHLVWVIVGDRARIESGLRSLDLGELHLVDADGNPRPTS